MKTSILIFLITMTHLSSPCQHDQHENKANEHMHQHSIEELTKRFEDPSRDAWQKPDQVIALLGDIRGKTIVDIGSGSGYFTFRLAEKGARVVAADVNDDFQRFIAAKKKELNYGDDRIMLKKIPYDSPELAPSSVDAVIIVNTYHHIENRVPYFRQVLDGLVKGGLLMVVDFKKDQVDQDAPGPPPEMKVSSEEVMEELKQSGFSEFSVDTDLLRYQYVIRAYKET
jgi:SAM-dependent methyltransferase